MSIVEKEFAVIGERIPKYDAPEKVTGATVYGSDLQLPGMLVGKMLRSPLPHARILHIDGSRALRLKGVKAVVTAADTPRRGFGYGHDNMVLKPDKVRYIGDDVAAVAATDEETALEALQLIQVEYEPLPAVYDPVAAMQPGAPVIHEARPNNVSMTWDFSTGDIEAALSDCDVVVEDVYRSHYIHAAAIEPHTCLAHFDYSGNLTVYAPVHMAFMYKKEVSEVLGVPWSKIRVVQPPIGGSFGGKIDIEPFDFATVLLAQKTGRPVRMIFNREEEFLATRPRQPMILKLRSGAKRDGTLWARDIQVISDNGAYNSWGGHTMLVVMNTTTSLYRVPHVQVHADVVYTNKLYGGSIRGFGNPQATLAIESQMDQVAEALGMDALEFRLRNANQSGDVTPQGMKITSCGLRESLERAAQAVGWREKRGRRNGRGVGVAAYLHVAGGARIYRSDGCGAVIKIDDSGRVTLVTGSSELGQGGETVQAQIIAEELGIGLGEIRVVNTDTDVKPWDVGVHASRSTFIAGNAAMMAVGKVKQQLFEAAAERLEAAAEDLVAREGRIHVRGTPGRGVTIAQAVRHVLLRSGGDMVMGEAFYDPPTEMQDESYHGNISAAYGFGAHAVEVEVDPETGLVRVVQIAAAHDVGRALNPMGVEGQIQGGTAMGLGYALTEEMIVNAEGKLANPSFVDYKLPLMPDVPEIKTIIVETVDPNGPFGAKGVGETGVIPPGAAIANAVYDATGVRIKNLPMNAEKVFWALQEKEREA